MRLYRLVRSPVLMGSSTRLSGSIFLVLPEFRVLGFHFFAAARRFVSLFGACDSEAGPSGPPYPTPKPGTQEPRSFGPEPKNPDPPSHPPVGVKAYVPVGPRFQNPMVYGRGKAGLEGAEK